jgi:preprotein translocase subunit SecF
VVHWILLSTLGKVLTVVAAVIMLAVVVQTLTQTFSSILIFAAIIAVVSALFVRRRDLNRAIARQLQRDADEDLRDRNAG